MLRRFIKLTANANVKCYPQVRFCANHLDQKEMKSSGDKITKQQHNLNTILGKYTGQDEENILNIVNNYNLKELLRYDITKGRADKLLAWRSRNGLLSNLNDIFLVEGFGLKATDKFYQSLLKEPKTGDIDLGKVNRVKRAPFVIPHIEAEQQCSINSCVSVRIGVNSITWSKLELPPAGIDEPCQLSHWQHHDISEKKLHLYELVQRCLYVNHLIPTADCYIFENPQVVQASNNPGSVEQQNISIQKAQVTAVMAYALASRNSPINRDQEFETEDEMKSKRNTSVYYVRRFLTARLFNHLVGTERISSEQTILNMMRTYYNMDDFMNIEDDAAEQQPTPQTPAAITGNVQFPMELRQMFSKSPRYHREFLGQVLLLNLTFVRLVLQQDAESIAKVTRSGKNKNESNDES